MRSYDDLIGVRFAYGGRGPDAYDCYGLLRELYARDGLKLPDYPSPTDGPGITAVITGELRLWEQTTATRGAAALIRVMDKHGRPNLHCAYLIDSHRMIHTWEDSGGVVIEPLSNWTRRILGFYRYVG